MTTAPLTRPPATDTRHARLRLKPPGPPTGYVDGGWWPRSRDLVAELPALLDALVPRVGETEQVTYHLSDWDCAARRLAAGGASVRLGGYHTQHADTVDVISAKQRFTLLVIAPDTASGSAERVLSAAADPGDTGGVDELLGSGTADHHHPDRQGARS